MKNKNTSISVVALMIITLIFTGCVNNQTKTENETIKIGVVVPLSGNGATIGGYSKEGVQMAVDEINAIGGLLGKQILIEAQDSKSDPKEGVNIIKNMMSKKQKPFIVYSIISGVTMAIRPETEANKVILMAAVGTDKFLPNSSYTIRNYLSASTIAKYIIPFIKDSLKIKEFGVFYANNEYSTSVKNAVEKVGSEANLSFQFSQPFDEKVPNYKSLITANISNNTKCLFIDGIGTGLGALIKQIRETGYKGLIISTPLVKFPDVQTAAGDAIKGVSYLDFAYDENSEQYKNNEFVKKFRTKYKSNPANFAYVSYEGMYMLLSKINDLEKLDVDVIIKEMNSVASYPGVFGNISINNREFEFVFAIKKF